MSSWNAEELTLKPYWNPGVMFMADAPDSWLDTLKAFL